MDDWNSPWKLMMTCHAAKTLCFDAAMPSLTVRILRQKSRCRGKRTPLRLIQQPEVKIEIAGQLKFNISGSLLTTSRSFTTF
jgi:hypothetical protein